MNTRIVLVAFFPWDCSVGGGATTDLAIPVDEGVGANTVDVASKLGYKDGGRVTRVVTATGAVVPSQT